jgi:ABC-2 type transport system permease protein
MQPIIELFKANLKIVIRNRSGIFWTILMPSFIYVALSVLPIGQASPVKYSDYVLPGIIAMTIMQGGIYGLAYWMTDLKARGVIKRFLVTPLKPWHLVLGLLTSRILVTIVQVIVITLLGIIAFNAQFAGNIISSLILVLLGSGIFLLLGLLISNFATSYESAAPITSAIGLPLTFLGNIFYPVDSLPNALRIFAKLLPITYLSDGLRNAYLKPFDIHLIGKDVLILALWFIGILALTIWAFRLKE